MTLRLLTPRLPLIILLAMAWSIVSCDRRDDSPPPVPNETIDRPRTNATDLEPVKETAPAPTPQTYRGRITIGFERSLFQPEGTNEFYWAKGPLHTLPIERHDRTIDHFFDVEVEGVISEPGNYGHLGLYSREIRISKLLKTEPVR